MPSNRSGDLVREQRERAGLSQAALARKLRISARTLAYIEGGEYRVSPERVVAILRVLGLTEDRSERVERLRCLAVELPTDQLDRIVLQAAEAGGDFEDIQSVIYQAKVAWMAQHGRPDGVLTHSGSSGRMPI